MLTAPRPSVGDSPLHFGDNRPPLGLGYIAAYLEKHGHQTKIVDLYHFWGEISKPNPGVKQEEPFPQLSIDLDSEIQSFQPDFIGIYIQTLSYYIVRELARELKQKYPGIILMCGGPHPTVLPESIPAEFDHVVIGEGEFASLSIVEGRIRDRIIQGTRVKNLDDLPWPNYDWFIDKPYNWKLSIFGYEDLQPVLTLNTSRGCPYLCRFCGVRYVSGRRFRGISPEKLVMKLIGLQEKYEVKGAYFREDNFTSNISRLQKFCDLMIEKQVNLKWACESRVKELSEPLIEKMVKAGCCGLYIGVESGSQRILEYIKKKESVEDFLDRFQILHNHGIKTYTTWVYGFPTETREDRRFSADLLARLNPTFYDRFVYIGLPKSYFYCQLDKNNKYELKELNGIIYPMGYLSLAQQLYGQDDPRCKYVEKIYENNNVSQVHITL